MHTSSRQKPKQDLIFHHEELFEDERKKLPFFIAASLLFIGIGFWTVMIGQSVGWVLIFFSCLILLIFLALFMWEPLLAINEEGMRIRPNPLLFSIILRWNEIVAITPCWRNGDPYVDFALSPVHLETFLHHQSPLTRKFLEIRMNRLHPIVHLRADTLPCTVNTLFTSIQEHFPIQLQHHPIQFGDISVFDETPE